MQYVPLWTSILRSRKVAALPDDLKWLWIRCLLTAQEYDHRNGTLPSVDDMSYSLHIDPPEECQKRLETLVTLHFLDECEGVFIIHDWGDWKVKNDRTGAERTREWRRKNKQPKERKEVTEMLKQASVTAVTLRDTCDACDGPTQLNSTQLNSKPPTPETGGLKEGDEPFHPGEIPPILPTGLSEEKQRVLDRQIQRFGASNGDRIIVDLLRDYSAEIVSDACDYHFMAEHGGLYEPRLRGVCKAMASGKWKSSSKTNASQSQETYKPAKIYTLVE